MPVLALGGGGLEDNSSKDDINRGLIKTFFFWGYRWIIYKIVQRTKSCLVDQSSCEQSTYCMYVQYMKQYMNRPFMYFCTSLNSAPL